MVSHSGSDNNQTIQPAIQSSIRGEEEDRNKERERLSLDEVVKSCLSGVQHLEDMEFNISNTRNDGKEFFKVELKIPRNSLIKYAKSNNKYDKQHSVNTQHMDNTQTISFNHLPKNNSLNPSYDVLCQSSSLGIGTHNRLTRSSPETRHPQRKCLDAHEMQNGQSVLRIHSSMKSTHQRLPEATHSKPRKPDEEENESRVLCKACGDISSKFVHYGGKSCQSCRAFFRRTVEKSTR